MSFGPAHRPWSVASVRLTYKDTINGHEVIRGWFNPRLPAFVGEHHAMAKA